MRNQYQKAGFTLLYVGFFTVGLLTLGGCNTSTVKSTVFTPAVQDNDNTPEELLLDVGVALFDPGLDDIAKKDMDTTFPDIRTAEAQYVPYLMVDTLQSSGVWGVVRIIPNNQSRLDVSVEGKILQSDGETMRLDIIVKDVTGRHWFSKEYTEHISKFSYDPRQRRSQDPFQGLYNRIANDMLAYKNANLSDQQAQNIRTISALQFAKNFSPQAFAKHIGQNEAGNYVIKSLPAENDPLLRRINNIRERDYIFVDTLQEYYSSFVRQMKMPYDEWRKLSYHETIALRELEAGAKKRFIIGTAVILGGIAASTSGSGAAQQSGTVGVAAGSYLIKSGFDKKAEAKIHIEALEELGQSLESTIIPHVIELEDRSVTLTGTVENQYSQWREILDEIYNMEVGNI